MNPNNYLTGKSQIQLHHNTDHTFVTNRRFEFDYLRSFTVILVLIHHAIIAYTTFASINFEYPIATSSPIVNAERWPIFDLMVVYNETFFMPLLFFVSGLFIWRSLMRKGPRKFIETRLKRLGIPFVLGVLFLIPIAYFPTQLQIGQILGVTSNFWKFWLEMIKSCFGTAGPLWFIWLLLVFNYLAAILYRVTSSWSGSVRRRFKNTLNHPYLFLGKVIAISIIVYIPIALLFGPLRWIGIGPFKVQAGRILLYLVYFVAGTAIGANGLNSSLFSTNGILVKHWWKLMILGLISYIAFIIMIVVLTQMERTIFSELAFIICCGSTIFGLTGFFLRFMNRRIRIFDYLSKNSYGIYIVHYGFITWLQYFILGIDLSPLVKGLLVFAGTLILSWITIALIRRIPSIGKII